MYDEPTVDWTDDAITTLKAKWADGWSHSQIAALLPHATRSSIAGKIMRLKLPPREKGRVRGQPRITARRAAPPPVPPVTSEGRIRNVTRLQAKANGHDPGPMKRRNPSHNILAAIAIAEDEPGLPERLKGEAPDGSGVQLFDLNKSTCRWPKGDPMEPNFEFCGCRTVFDKPYCAHHTRKSLRASNREVENVE